MKKIFTLIGLSFLVAGSVSAQIVPTLTVTTTNATNCTAPCNGTATLVTGGITGATYLWSTTPAQTTATATGLCPGVYTCTVTLSVIGSSTGTGTVTCTSTGINEIAVDENISLFPNPAYQELNLQLDNPMDGQVALQIINILGKVSYQEVFEANGLTTKKINISSLPAGIYDLELVGAGRITRQKFIKE